MKILQYPNTAPSWRGDYLLTDEGRLLGIKTPAAEAALTELGVPVAPVSAYEFNELYWQLVGGGTEPVAPVKPPPPKPAPGPVVFRTAISLNSVQFVRVADYSISTVMAQVCAQAGVPSTYWVSGAVTVASRESSFDVNAINDYDLNAHGPIVADGYPEYCSRGSLQFIAPTFADNHHAGTSNDIYDGHALCWAFINYTMGNYGVRADGSNLAQQVQQADPNRQPRGYLVNPADGTNVPHGLDGPAAWKAEWVADQLIHAKAAA